MAWGVMPGCAQLAVAADAAAGGGGGFGGVADQELAGLVCAWDRVEAHAAARKLIAIAEVFRRNPEDGFETGPGQMPEVVHEFTRDQLALALGESRAAADWLLTVAWHLGTRLGGTLDALRDGAISRGKAELIVRLTQHLDADEAAAAEAKVLDRAGRLTPGGLRSAVARAVIEVAPEKARERRETAARFARVERWAEDSGNAALMGRELPPAEVLAADQRICWWAGELKAAGLDGGMDELRARAFLDLVLGKDSRPRRDAGDGAGAQQPADAGPAGGVAGGFAGQVTLTVPLCTAAGLADRPGELGGLGPVDPGWPGSSSPPPRGTRRQPGASRSPTSTATPSATAAPGPNPRATGNVPVPGRRAGPGSASSRPAGTGRRAGTAPGDCASRAEGPA
jgi:hypothetical protein